MNKIFVQGLEILAKHGVNDFEKEQPQKFIFDIEVEVDFFKAYKTDDIQNTVNYASISKLVTQITQANTYNLIEKLAYECTFSIFENFHSVLSVNLKLYKPQAPMNRKFDSVGVSISLERETVYLSLGSSIGDKKCYLDTAIEKLEKVRGVVVKKISPYLESKPYGGVAQNTFLNCAVEIKTFLPPHALLDEIQTIENACGRVREKKWGDRTLDIDIIFFGDKNIADDRLIIPHPDYQNRDFVKYPLKNIAPHLFK